MDYFMQAWARTGKVEGGYANDPADPGGETMWGITARVARAYGYTGSMAQMPRGVAAMIAKGSYWDTLRLDEIAQISPAVALELFDTNFNLWYGAAGQWLQKSLNALTLESDLETDGVVGGATIATFGRFMKQRGRDGETVMLRCLNSLQCADYIRQAASVPAKERFLYGWVLQRVSVDGDSTPRV